MGADDGFEIETLHPASEVVVLRVSGEVDLWASLPLMEAIVDAFAEDTELIAVDLSDVRSMDATGVQAVKDGARHAEDMRMRFAVVCPSINGVADLVQLAGLDRTVSVHESMGDALGPWLAHDGSGSLADA